MLAGVSIIFLGVSILVAAGMISVLQIRRSSDVIYQVYLPIQESARRADLLLRDGENILYTAMLDVTEPENFDRVEGYEAHLRETMRGFDVYIKALRWGSESDIFAQSSGGSTRAEWESAGLAGRLIVQQAPDEIRSPTGKTDIYYAGFANNGLKALSSHREALQAELLGRTDEAMLARQAAKEYLRNSRKYERLTRNELVIISAEVDLFVFSLLADVKRAQQVIIATWGSVAAVFLMLLMVFSRIFSRKIIVEPVMKLSQAAQAIGRGQYDTRIGLQSSSELQILADSFNLMADQLGKTTAQLEHYQVGLEAQIRERTSELTSTNELLLTEISERQRAEEKINASLQEKEVLLREIHHRVKNNLQVIASLLNLQSRNILDERVLEPLRESQTRIESMALIHQKLYDSDDLMVVDFAEYSRNLATHLLSSYGVSQKVALRVDSDAGISLAINSAIPCGLIINELVSNSLKYAFSGRENGEIRIALRRKEDGRIKLTVADNGAGIPDTIDFRNTESLGLRLVNILSGQLEGTLELEKIGGTKFELTFVTA
jgi:two-component sensor histidine kinase/HAMP domain-containing protein